MLGLKPFRLLRASAAVLVALLTAGGVFQSAHAQGQTPLLDEVHTVALLDQGVPVEQSFTISAAGTYQVVLTDEGTDPSSGKPAPLARLKLAVTFGDAIIGTPLTGAGTMTFAAASAGSYVIHVTGAPTMTAGSPTPGSGPFGVVVTNTSDGSQIDSFSGTLALPGTALPGNEATFDSGTFTVPGGSYQLSLADLDFPQPLASGTPTLLLVDVTDNFQPIQILPDPQHGNAMQATLTLNANITYRVFAVGQAGASGGGLFSVSLRDSSGSDVFPARAVPVGAVELLGDPALTSAGSYQLVLADLKFPAALTGVGAALVMEGALVTPALSASGSSPSLTLNPSTYQVFGYGGAANPPGAGSLAVELQQAGGGTPVFSAVQTALVTGSQLSAYVLPATISSAGNYNVQLSDFDFPAALSSLQLLAVQGTSSVAPAITAASTFSASLTSGPLELVVFAQPPAVGGLFGVDVTPNAGGAAAFATTQAVGSLFASRQVSITTAGSYAVSVSDLAFPAAFSSLYAIVTQGSSTVGTVVATGSTASFNFQATPGNYLVNFIAQPTGPDEAGTYVMTVTPTPSPPTVMLSADATSVSSGGSVHLIWSSQNATSCSSSGGTWTGTQPTSGTASSGAISSDTTFTLTCSGSGGQASKSVTVAVSPASSSGGGGALAPPILIFLAALALWRARRRSNAG